MSAIFNIIFLHNYQDADVSSMAAVETVGCKYCSFVNNNMTVVVVAKKCLQFHSSIYLCIVMNI